MYEAEPQPQRGMKPGCRCLEFAFVGQGDTPVVVGFGRLRIELQRHLKFGDGFVVGALSGQCDAEIITGPSCIRD